jgi:hypothetical protein
MTEDIDKRDLALRDAFMDGGILKFPQFDGERVKQL